MATKRVYVDAHHVKGGTVKLSDLFQNQKFVKCRLFLDYAYFLAKYTKAQTKYTKNPIRNNMNQNWSRVKLSALINPIVNVITPNPFAPTRCFAHCHPLIPTNINEIIRKMPKTYTILASLSNTAKKAIRGTILKKIVHRLTNHVSTTIPHMIVTHAIRISAPTGDRIGNSDHIV